MSKNPRLKVVKYGWLGRAVWWGFMVVVLVSWAFMTRPPPSFSYTFVICGCFLSHSRWDFVCNYSFWAEKKSSEVTRPSV
ncbi:hypothetical protein NC651_026052 [Populus alba x Populus x berolinensis]|nr:hypothetical protein NC651_026052 [Populus alba x Populus x berolinensis]